MIDCVAAWCRNSSSKGFKMYYFPRNKERRDAWIININRANWSPTRYSALCEAHFAPDMWEKKRINGKKKLKSCAIPTIFVRSKTHLPLNRKKHEDNGIIRRTNILNSITLQRKSKHSIKRGEESQSECNKKLYRSKETNSEQIIGNNNNLYQSNIESSALKEKRLEKNISESLSGGVKMTKTISNSTDNRDNRYILKIKINKIHKTH